MEQWFIDREIAQYGLQVPEEPVLKKKLLSFIKIGNGSELLTPEERITFMATKQRHWIGRWIRRSDGLRCKIIAVVPLTEKEYENESLQDGETPIYKLQIELPDKQRMLIRPPTKIYKPKNFKT